MRIGLDAMGGDYAPQVTVKGAIDSLNFISPQSTIVLFGDREQIEKLMPMELRNDSRIEIVPTTEVIEMGDHPAQAFTRKPDSSISVGFRHLMEDKIQGFASAGSTGAMMVGCMYTVKQISGIIRPTIATAISTSNGSYVTILDVGLNADCKPEVLNQYATIGSIYAKEIFGITNPRVALLNIGEEAEKGNILTKATYPVMQQNDRINFVGNVEGKHIFDGTIADVIVCDGFTGNTILKQAEGFYNILTAMNVTGPFIEGLNYENIGGTPVLGINSNVIIGHGCSSAKAITNMILQTEKTIASDIVSKFKVAFN